MFMTAMMVALLFVYILVSDPGFPVGGRRPGRRGADSRGGYVLKIFYVETKESGPLRGVHRARP